MDRLRLDEIATTAIVASTEVAVDRWWCKAAPDLPFRRANVAVPPVDAADDPVVFAHGLDQVRRWYHERGLRLIVQVSSARPGWELVDSWLGAAGLAVEAPVHLMTAEGADVDDARAGVRSAQADVTTGVDAAWAAEHGHVVGGGPVARQRAQAYGRMLTGLGDRALGASRRVDGRVVGVGFGVLDGGWLGLFGMVTAPAHRRQGVATDLVLALQGGARARRAERTYLQVETDNAAAIALYGELGFTISHDHHYRSEGTDPAQGC